MLIGSFFLSFLLVIGSSHQESSPSTEMRTPGAPVELVTMLAGSREWASLPARHGTVPAASRVTGHTEPPASDGDVTPPGAGSPENPSADTVTHLLPHSHPPGEFYGCESPVSCLGSVPVPQLEMQIFERNPTSGKWGFFFQHYNEDDSQELPLFFLPPSCTQGVLPIHWAQRLCTEQRPLGVPTASPIRN